MSGLFSGMGSVIRVITINAGHRRQTLEWMMSIVCLNTKVDEPTARAALLKAIPPGTENCLDGGETFIFALDEAITVCGGDPFAARFGLA